MDSLFNRWNLSFRDWVRDLSSIDIEELDEVSRSQPLYYSSREIQFVLEELLCDIEINSKVKSGDYKLNEGAIEAHGYSCQLCSMESKQFGTTVELRVDLESFSLTTTFGNLECVSAQKDNWWKDLISLLHTYDCEFTDYHKSGSRRDRSIQTLLKKLLTNETEIEPIEFGTLCVKWGSVLDLKASLVEGVKVFKLLHSLNHSLYRTSYTRRKRNESRCT